jgi:hypothetical protein
MTIHELFVSQRMICNLDQPQEQMVQLFLINTLTLSFECKTRHHVKIFNCNENKL